MKLHTPETVAKMLDVSPATLKKWRVKGVDKGPPFIKIANKMVRYPDDMLHEWIYSDEQ